MNYLNVKPENIPEELKGLKQWVIWKGEQREGKVTKVPYDANSLKMAKSNGPETWTNFETAFSAYKGNGFDGIGIVLSKDDPLCGWDFDKCRDSITGEPEAEIKEYIKSLNSYAEVSPSGTGYRVILKATLPQRGRKRGQVEVYEAGRYLTITGHSLEGMPKAIEDRQDETTSLHKKIFIPKSYLKNEVNSVKNDTTLEPTENKEEKKEESEKTSCLSGLSGLLQKAFSSTNGDKIARLYNGDFSDYPSQSEADAALCSHLSFWLSRDATRIDAAFKQSGLYREKWDSKHFSDGRTYGQVTIERAIEGTTEVYTEKKPQERDEKPRHQIITLENIYSKKLEEKPIISGFRYEEEQTVIYASGGVGKSLIEQDIAMHLGAGLDTLWDLFDIPTHRLTMFVQSENSRLALHQRAFLKCQGNSDFLRGLQNIIFMGTHNGIQTAGHVSDKKFLKAVIDFGNMAETELENKIGTILFDPLISFHDAEENDNSRMRTTLDYILEIGNALKTTTAIIHHANKEQGLRGASAIWDWARNIIKLEDKTYKGEKRISFKHEKCNNSKTFEPFLLQMDDNLNFSPLDFTDTLPHRERERCLNVKKALEMLNGYVESKAELVEQYREITGTKSLTTIHRHINKAVKNEFINVEFYTQGKLKKARYYLDGKL